MDGKDKKILTKYRKRLVRIGILESTLVSLVFGLAVIGIAAIITWFCDLSLLAVLLISIGAGVVVTAAMAPLLYFKRFYPTTQRTARILDKAGLEERVVTMCQYENDRSMLAALQREDAKSKLSGVNEKCIIFHVSLWLIIALIVCGLFAVSFTTVSALAAEGIINSGGEVIGKPSDDAKDNDDDEEEKDVYYTIRYMVILGEGHIEGELTQTVKKGANTKQVVAVPDEGFMFYAWTDEAGTKVLGVDATRMEFKVKSDMTICALFIETPEDQNGGDEEQGEDEKKPGDDEGSGDEEGEKNGPNGSGGSSGGAGQNGENGNSGEGGEGSGDDNGEASENVGSTPAGKREDNSVIDGKQDYKDSFDREQNDKELAEDDTLPDELKDILGDYYGALDP